MTRIGLGLALAMLMSCTASPPVALSPTPTPTASQSVVPAPTPTPSPSPRPDLTIVPAGEIRGDHALVLQVSQQPGGATGAMRFWDVPVDGTAPRQLLS